MTERLLTLDMIHAGYGAARVLFGVSLTIDAGEVVTLLGRNGMGKTTTIRAMFGLVTVTSGRVLLGDRDVTRAAPFLRARAGLGLVPEGRQVFPRLSVEENLIATARDRQAADTRQSSWTLERVYRLFPRLAERRRNMGNELSGGEQQMLAIGRALMTNPRLIVLDEATEGLAPVVRQEIWSAIRALKADGHAILIVDKNIEALLGFADRHIVIERGEVAWVGTTADLRADRESVQRYLAV